MQQCLHGASTAAAAAAAAGTANSTRVSGMCWLHAKQQLLGWQADLAAVQQMQQGSLKSHVDALGGWCNVVWCIAPIHSRSAAHPSLNAVQRR
jgi:hypothetical protein